MKNPKDIVLETLRDLKRPPREVPERMIILSVLVVLGVMAPFLNLYWLQVLIYGLFMATIALSNDLLNGFAGVFSSTPLIFWGIGGFTAAVLSGGYHPYIPGGALFIGLRINPWLTILIAGLVAAGAGAAISFPSLRLKGVYIMFLLIVFNQILERAILNEEWLTGGQIGFQLRIPLPWVSDTRITYFYLALALLAITYVGISKVVNSRWGLALRALGDDEEGAKQLGVSIVRYRLIAFFIASFFMGCVGALYAYTFKYINEGMVNLLQSFLVIVMSILGGVSTLVGPMVGAIIYIVVSEYLRFLGVWRYVIFAIVLLAIMVLLPQGIVGKLLEKIKRR